MKIILILIFLFNSNLGYTQFSDQIVIDASVSGINELIISDINKDGLKDILLAQRFFLNNKISYYPNSGKARFSLPIIIAQDLGTPESVAAGDLNGDGWKEIVSVWSITNQIILHQNNQGTFSQTQILDSNFFGPAAVKLEDIDNDNDLDIIAVGDIEFAIFYNDGTNQFNFTKVIVASGISTENYTLEVVDIDGDNFKDILIGGVHVLIYKNSNGVFSYDANRTQSITDQNLTFLTHLNDFDADGDMDLLINGNSFTNLSWFSNNGQGFFSLKQIIDANTAQTNSITSADFDNDGDIDLFTAFPQLGTLVWYENQGNGNYTGAVTVETGDIPSTEAVMQGDLDQNGSNDLIWGSPLTLHLNNFNFDPIFNNGFEINL
jgi:hypothetical protein